MTRIALMCNAGAFLPRKGKNFYANEFPHHATLWACSLTPIGTAVTLLQTAKETARFSGMARNFTGNYAKSTNYSPYASNDPRATQVDQFLDEFATPTSSMATVPTKDGDPTLREKVDAITERVRHASQEPAVGAYEGSAYPHLNPAEQDQGEVPVKMRLDTMELMLKEIRDSMNLAKAHQTTLGQAQPRVEPVGTHPPARVWVEQPAMGSRPNNGREPPVMSGQSQPRGGPLGRPLTASDRRTYPTNYWSEGNEQTDTLPRGRGASIPPHRQALSSPADRPRHRQPPPAAINREQSRDRRTQYVTRPATTERLRHHTQSTAPAHDERKHRKPRSRRISHLDQETSSSTGTGSDTDTDSIRRRNDPTDRRLVTHAISRQYHSMGQPTGRNCDILPPTVRPHDALPPDMKRRVRERTGKKNRHDLTFQEYVCGYARMLLTELDPHTDLYAIINHLAHFAQDAASAPWPSVRVWTTTCLDYIDDGDVTWRDTTLFDAERNRIAREYGRQDTSNPIPCPAFNNDTCKLTPPHVNGEYRLLHTCAICYYAAPTNNRAESTTHCAKTCNRRRRSGREEWDPNNRSNNKRSGSGYNNYNPAKKDSTESKPKN